MLKLILSLLITIPLFADAQADFDYTVYSVGHVRSFPAAKDTTRDQLTYKVEKHGDKVTISPIGNPTDILWSGTVAFIGATQTTQALVYNAQGGARLVIQPLYGCIVLITGPTAQNTGGLVDKNTYDVLGGCAYNPQAATQAQPPQNLPEKKN